MADSPGAGMSALGSGRMSRRGGQRSPPRRYGLPILRQLITFLAGLDPIQALAGGEVKDVRVRSATEADVGRQLLAGRDVGELFALRVQHLNARTMLAARGHPDVALAVRDHAVGTAARLLELAIIDQHAPVAEL